MRTISLGGAWRFREVMACDTPEIDPENGEWLPASVPGCVHTDLMSAERIPDPFYRMNEDEVQLVAEKDSARHPFRYAP